ncbi:hypothetical protein EN829_057330, partial [Mesorhizobium sp. M00.F.Ca.ET.186.01.1.1]
RHYDEGPSFGYYKLDQSIVQTKAKEADFFEGIAFTFDDLAKETASQSGGEKVASELKKLQKDAEEVVAAYPSFAAVAKEAHEMLSDVQKAQKDVQSSSLPEASKTDLLHRLDVKQAQLNKASAEALSLVTKVKPETNELVAGQTAKVTVSAYNGGQAKVSGVNLALNVPKGWQAKALSTTSFSSLSYNQTVKTTFEVTVPSDASLFQPYAAPAITADVSYSFAGSKATSHVTPADAVAVLPAFSMSLAPSATVLNTLKSQEPIPVKVTVKNYNPGAAKTNVSLQVPEGWSV